MKEMKLLGETIQLNDGYIEVDKLKFLQDNPRVYASTHGVPNFNDLTDEQKQDVILEKLLQEPSVKNLKPEIRRHGGLIEPILVRHDRMEVIEGNSRLAVYRELKKAEPGGEWESIPCDIVSSLTDNKQLFSIRSTSKAKQSGRPTKRPISPMFAGRMDGLSATLQRCLAKPK